MIAYARRMSGMKTAYVFVALGVLACNTRSSSSAQPSAEANATIQQARAAIRSLEDRDTSAIQACEADAQSCFEALADGGASDACEALREQCREAKDALDDVRTPVVDCWNQVEDCAQAGKGFRQGDASADAGTSCSVEPRDCEDMGQDADEDRNPVLECRSEVFECIRSIRQRPSDWRAECGEVREACSEICGLAERAVREHDRRRPDGVRARIRRLLDGLRERRHGGGHDASDRPRHEPDGRIDAGHD